MIGRVKNRQIIWLLEIGRHWRRMYLLVYFKILYALKLGPTQNIYYCDASSHEAIEVLGVEYIKWPPLLHQSNNRSSTDQLVCVPFNSCKLMWFHLHSVLTPLSARPPSQPPLFLSWSGYNWGDGLSITQPPFHVMSSVNQQIPHRPTGLHANLTQVTHPHLLFNLDREWPVCAWLVQHYGNPIWNTGDVPFCVV